MTEQYTGVVDRIVEGKTAVILLEADTETVDELNLPVEQIPDNAAREGMVVDVAMEDVEVVSIMADPDETEARLERNRDRLQRLGTPPSERDEE